MLREERQTDRQTETETERQRQRQRESGWGRERKRGGERSVSAYSSITWLMVDQQHSRAGIGQGGK